MTWGFDKWYLAVLSVGYVTRCSEKAIEKPQESSESASLPETTRPESLPASHMVVPGEVTNRQPDFRPVSHD